MPHLRSPLPGIRQWPAIRYKRRVSLQHLQFMGRSHCYPRRPRVGRPKVQDAMCQVSAREEGLSSVIHLLPIADQLQLLARAQGSAVQCLLGDPAALPMPNPIAVRFGDNEVIGRHATENETQRLISDVSGGPHHQDSGEAKIRESTAGVSRKPSSDCKACGCSSKHLCGLTAWNTWPGDR